MAFEVFDDVAFYWFLLSVLAAFLGPLSCSYASFGGWAQKQDWTWNLSSCRQKNFELAQHRRRQAMQNALSPKLFLFIGGWVLFVILVLQVTSMQGEELVSFDPFKLLEIEDTAEPSEIKKAYRKLSLKYHPDKNPDNAEAQQKFILIAKAYEVLTDAATRENYEKYGNPDGYHGTSVTIGLPSFLTNKDNELGILIIYFLVIIVVIPVGVGLWWKNSSKFLEDGIMQTTALRFWRQIQENTAHKYIPGILASAMEYSELIPRKNSQAQDIFLLHKQVEDQMVKNQGDVNMDIMKVKILLYAHLMRLEIPEALRSDMKVVLEHAHRLLNAMLNICLENRYVTVSVNVIEFSQQLTQALWFHETTLLQLPHVSEKHLRFCRSRKHGITTMGTFKALPMEQRHEILKDLSEKQLQEVDIVCDHFPEVGLAHRIEVEGVEDNEDVYEGDVVTLHITVERKHLPEEPKTDSKSKEPKTTAEIDEILSKLSGKERERRKEQLLEAEQDLLIEDQKRKYEEDKGKRFEKTTFFGTTKRGDAPTVHAPQFPFEKDEGWIILLVDMKSNKLVASAPLWSSYKFEEVPLRFLAPNREGRVEYEVFCKSTTYAGCDRKHQVKIDVMRRVDEDNSVGADGDHDESDEEEEEEEEEEGKWYYLGGSNFGEFILNIIALLVAGVMLFNFLYAKGWWQKFVQPALDWLCTLLQPIFQAFGVAAAPAWTWFSSNVYDFRHFADVFSNEGSNTTNASILGADLNATINSSISETRRQNLAEDMLNEKRDPYANPYERPF